MDELKKGFTLIELLGVFVVISLITFIIVPKVSESIKQNSEKLLNNQIALIEKAAYNYVLKHEEVRDPYHLNVTLLSLDTLKDGEVLDRVTIKNPVTDEVMNGCVVVAYNHNLDSYTYKYSEKTCDELKVIYPTIVSAYEKIIDSVDTKISGDGLYEIDNEYVYRGKNPNNYLKIGQDLYRIISLNKDTKNIKVIKVSGELKNWEENTNFDSLSFRITSINSYLNSTFYNTLSDKVKKYIEVNSTWYVGSVSGTQMDIQTLKSVEKSSTYNTNIGLLNLHEYSRASLSKKCNSNYLSDECGSSNYLNFGSNYWLINDYNDKVWYVNSIGKISNTTNANTSLYKVLPVFNLVIHSEITGTGTSSDPYILIEKG